MDWDTEGGGGGGGGGGRLLSATPGWLLLMIHLVFGAFFPDACWLLLSVQTSEAAQTTRRRDASKQRELNEFNTMNKITWDHKGRTSHLYSLSATRTFSQTTNTFKMIF